MNREQAVEAAKAVERGEAPSGSAIIKLTGDNSLSSVAPEYATPIVTLSVYRSEGYPANNVNYNQLAGLQTLYLYPYGTMESEVAPRLREMAITLVVRSIGGRRIAHLEPVIGCPPNHVGYMFGGTYAGTSDSRFATRVEMALGQSFYGALAVHDRHESQGDYDSLSR